MDCAALEKFSFFQQQLPQLYLHDAALIADPGYQGAVLEGMHALGERAIWLCNPHDTVVVSRPLDQIFLDHLESLGVSLPTIVSLNSFANQGACVSSALFADSLALEQLNKWSTTCQHAFQLSTFRIGAESQTVQERLGQHLPKLATVNYFPDTVQQANHKATTRTWAEELNASQNPGAVIHIKPGEDASCKIWNKAQELLDAASHRVANPRLIIKEDHSSSGNGNLILSRSEHAELAQWLALRPSVTTFVLEEFLEEVFAENVTTPNIQFFIDEDGHPKFVTVTDQRITKRLNYWGNIAPSRPACPNTLLDTASRMAAHLSTKGVRGLVGIDYICLSEADVRFVEVNARFNGSTYAQACVDQINRVRSHRLLPPFHHWHYLRCSIRAPMDYVELLQSAGDLLMSDVSKAGVVVLNPGMLPYSVASFVTMGENKTQVQEIENQICKRLGIALP